jgi:hypothetical protein
VHKSANKLFGLFYSKARCDGEELFNDGGSLGEMMKGGMAMVRFRVSKK